MWSRLLLPALLLLAGCSPASSPPAQNTPPSSAVSPAPTAEPFAKFKVEQAVKALQDAGLEVKDPRPYTTDELHKSPVPLTMKEAVRFLVPSVCNDCGGRVFSFDSPDDLEQVKRYYEGLGRASGVLSSWVFVKENILIQINGRLPEAKAKKYGEALANLH